VEFVARKSLRVFRVLAFPTVGVAGAWAALLILGPLQYTVGPFEMSYFLRPGPGQTDIALPPFGRLTVDTHTSPVSLTAALESVDPKRTEEAIRDTDLRKLADLIEAEALRALRTHALRALGLSAAGAGVAGLLVYRRQWRKILAAILGGVLTLGAATAAGWATYRREAFLEPEFSGSLEVAVELLGPIRRASGRLAEFRSEIERLAEKALDAYEGLAADRTPSQGAIVVVHISDIHASPLGMDLAQQLAESFEVDLVVDTGDITSFGTPLETAVTDRISAFGVPYLFVPGNHDSPAVADAIRDQPNAVVLENGSHTVAGLTIYGARHPLYTPDPLFDLSDEEIALAMSLSGRELAEDIVSAEEPPDIVAVHDDRMAAPVAGLVPLVLSGHFHESGQSFREGTLFLRIGSTGGGGLDTFTSDLKPYPLSAEVLYFDATSHALVAIDLVELDPDTRDLTVDRKLASELVADGPVPAQTLP
jgi:predicted phosphodiesterase